MKIIIGHYHYNPGGVTKIVQSQLNGLANKEDLEVVVIGDGQGFENINLPNNAKAIAFPKLGYLPEYGDEASLFQTVGEVLNFFKSVAEKQDIIHFHNIGLGKNAAVSYALYLLAKDGYIIINHAHDFPEDRPTNFKYLTDALGCLGITDINTVLYPQFENYIFGVLNSFDRNRLLDSGIKDSNIELWANPVSLPNISSSLSKAEAKAEIENRLNLDKGKMLVAYPVRVIRRKNIGELILLAALYGEVANFIVTLPPLNPVEIEIYNKWVLFCAENEINITFEAGMKAEFEHIMKGADVCFTTSIMEGFGMVFVEPWLWDTPVAGREIAAVLPDLKSFGITYPLIYDKINIEKNGALVDFPTLGLKEQMTTILETKESKRAAFIENNAEVDEFFNRESIIFENNNKTIISQELSEEQYGKRLYKIYRALS